MIGRILIGVFLCVMSLSLVATSSSAAESAAKWPSKPLTMVVPFGAGGGLDASARLLAKFWEKELGVKIVIANRDGAAGQIGTTSYMNLPDDGSNILMGAQIFYSTNILLQNAPYSIDDISVLNFTEIDRDCLSVMPDSPYQSFEALNAAIKANPGKIRLSTTNGSPAAVLIDYLVKQFDWDIKTISYEGAARQAALMGGHIDVGAGAMMTAMKANEKILIVWGDERLPYLPDVPTLNEVLGKKVPFMATSRFVAVRSSVKTKYPQRYKILAETLQKTYDNPEYQRALRESGRNIISTWLGPQRSEKLNKEIHEMVKQSMDVLKAK